MALESVGVTQRALDLLVAYAKEREQLGRPIGVYQAVSHKASNVYVRLQEARSLAYWAAWCVSEGDDMARQACLSAKSFAADTAVFACESAIQGHGGIGFTWEHVLHRYYKRAHGWPASTARPAPSARRLPPSCWTDPLVTSGDDIVTHCHFGVRRGVWRASWW